MASATENNPFNGAVVAKEPGVSPGDHSEREEEEVDQNEELSAGSERSGSGSESELEVDESVREDMDRLGDTFDELGFKFRMIDRIGEGKASHYYRRWQRMA